MGLEVRNIVKKYGKKEVLHKLSFEAKSESFTALLGPSGCGKTTLLNIIAGLTDIDGGEVLLDGKTVSTPSTVLAPEKRNIGMVFQDFALWPHMSVFQNVAFGLQMEGLPQKEIRERVMETLAIFHMETYAKNYPSELSGGQKQRIAMARAIAPRPKLLLMDEPLSSLDAQLREEMRWELLSTFQKFKITTLYVTHDQTEAMSMADEIVLLKDGYIEQHDTPENIYQHPKTLFAARFLDTMNEIPCTVEKLGMQGLTLQSPFGKLTVQDTSGYQIGDTINLTCRPYDLVPLNHTEMPNIKNESYNLIEITIKLRSFQGRVWRYIAGPTDSSSDCTIEFSSISPYKTGQTLALYVPVGACHILSDKPSKIALNG